MSHVAYHGLLKRRGAPVGDDDDGEVRMRLKLKRYASGKVSDVTRKDALKVERRPMSPVLLFPSSPPPPSGGLARRLSRDEANHEPLVIPPVPTVLASILCGSLPARGPRAPTTPCLPSTPAAAPAHAASDEGSDGSSLGEDPPASPPVLNPASLASLAFPGVPDAPMQVQPSPSDAAQSGSLTSACGSPPESPMLPAAAGAHAAALLHARELFWTHPKSRVVRHMKLHAKGGSMTLPADVYRRKPAGPGAVGGWVPPPLPPCVAALVSPTHRLLMGAPAGPCPLCSSGTPSCWEVRSPSVSSSSSINSTGSSSEASA